MRPIRRSRFVDLGGVATAHGAAENQDAGGDGAHRDDGESDDLEEFCGRPGDRAGIHRPYMWEWRRSGRRVGCKTPAGMPGHPEPA